ncbi:MAG: carboxypeptidase-like regulatory domain-containing protein [Planctomycetota bacterium]
MAEVRGRFLLEGGAPAAGATWYVEGSESNEELVRLHGLPEDWSDPTGTTDVDGRFVLRFDPPRAFQFWISVKAPGHAPAVWRPDIAPGQILDLGTVTLALGATVAGRLMDVAGMPILGERWSVRVQSSGLAAPDDREDPLTFADVDPATGAFRLDDVQPGPNVVEAYGPLSVEIEPVRVSLESGQFLTCDLAYSGPRSSTRILVAPRVRPNPQHRSLDPEHVRLRGDDGHERTAARHPQRTYLVFDDLPSGLYQLEIDDPWFKPWSQAGIAPGTEVNAQLEPCATVLLTARGPSGAVLPAEEVSVALLRPGGMPREIPLQEEDQRFDGRLALFPGDHALRVRSGTLEGELGVTGLGFDETRALEVALAEAPHLAGRLVDRDGTPIPDHEVLLLEPAAVDDSEASPVLPMNASSGDPERWRRQVGIALTAEDGSFRLPLRTVGTYLVQARRSAGVSVTSAPLTLAPGESRGDLELVLASGATVRGRVHGPPGISLAGMNLWIAPRGLQGRFDTFLKTPTVLSDDGTFALEGLPAGELGMLIDLPDVQRSEFGEDSCSVQGSSPIQVDVLEIAADATLEREPSIAALVGTIALDVSVNGVPCPWARVRLQQNNQILDGRAGSSGHWGPMLAFAGEWTVTISDPAGAWTWSSPNPVSVAAGVQRSESLSIEFVRASLRITDEEGHPRIDQRLHIAHEGARLPFAGGKTDAEGRAELGLAPGRYRISLDPFEGGVTVEWTASGPLVTELQL